MGQGAYPGGGMRMCWSALMTVGSVMSGLAARMAWSVTPNLCAMATRVSPSLTTYNVKVGLGLGAGVTVATGVGVATGVDAGGRSVNVGRGEGEGDRVAGGV